MKKLITIFFFLLCLKSLSQTTPIHTTKIPFSNPDLVAPFRGAEQWNTGIAVNVPVQGTNTIPYDAYYRFQWYQIETGNRVYDWSLFDQQMQAAITAGQKFSFSVMPTCPGCGGPQVGGALLGYPGFLHTLMQGEANPDWITPQSTMWVPNWNSVNYLAAVKNFCTDVQTHLSTTSFNGILEDNIIGYIDIRLYGAFGEWHDAFIVNQTSDYPTGTKATDATLDSIIMYQAEAFPNHQMELMMAVFDGNYFLNTQTDPQVGVFALRATNHKGLFGWRRDNWGDALDCNPQGTGYINQYLELNTRGFGTLPHMADSIMVRYKSAPIVGEPNNGSDNNGSTFYYDLPRQVQFYSCNSFGNGNIDFTPGANVSSDTFRLASKYAGYREILDTGSYTASPPVNGAFSVIANWKNVGIAPNYEHWNVTYQIRTGKTVLWSGVSSFSPWLFQPSGSDLVVTDNFTLSGVAAGVDSLYLIILDPNKYRFPLPLAITGVNADGSYLLGKVTVTASGAVANAGPNQTISTSSVTLTGAASVGATSYLWTNISGPNTPSITTPTTVGTTVTGLITGTYVFQLAINGGSSGQLISQVTIIVNIQTVQADAGSNQTITLPTNSVTLNGSGSQGATTYSWTNVSGPNTPSITTPTTVSTTVTGLIQGTYVFQLSINSGASTSQVQVTVLPAPAPVANAGVSQTITLPTSSVTLNGSGSTGYITSYAWTQASGPNTAVIATPTTVSTSVTGLIQGTYVFQLSLNGGASTDTMRVYVNPVGVAGTTIFTIQVTKNGIFNDGNQGGNTGIETAVKFQSSVAGYITGVRFLKTTGNAGTHSGQLYSYPGGTLLATATFTSETATGWQYVTFSSPVAITANTTYVAGVFNNLGNYQDDDGYFKAAVVNAPITGLADGAFGGPSGANGVYKYTNSAAYPSTDPGAQANYWVDIVFSPTVPNSCKCHGRLSINGKTILEQR